jgi:hypothetical protein
MAELWDIFETFFLALMLKIEMLMNEEGKVVAELRDEKWL